MVARSCSLLVHSSAIIQRAIHADVWRVWVGVGVLYSVCMGCLRPQHSEARRCFELEIWQGLWDILSKECLSRDYSTWIPREVTLPGLCPSGVREHRVLPDDVQSLSTTLEMKLGFESAPAYSYDLSESRGQWLRRQTMQETKKKRFYCVTQTSLELDVLIFFSNDLYGMKDYESGVGRLQVWA